MRDLHRNMKASRVVAPVAGAATGKIVDLAGYEGCEFIISYGSVTATNATITPVVKEGSVTGTMTSVADANLLGTEANAAIAAAASRTSGTSKNVVKRIGYIGAKRYVSCDILQTVTAAVPVSVTAILGLPTNSPVAT